MSPRLPTRVRPILEHFDVLRIAETWKFGLLFLELLQLAVWSLQLERSVAIERLERLERRAPLNFERSICTLEL